MKTRRNTTLRRRNGRKLSRKVGGKKNKTGKKWVTAVDAAEKILTKTGDIEAAKKTLRRQALTNARRLFGSISSYM